MQKTTSRLISALLKRPVLAVVLLISFAFVVFTLVTHSDAVSKIIASYRQQPQTQDGHSNNQQQGDHNSSQGGSGNTQQNGNIGPSRNDHNQVIQGDNNSAVQVNR